MPPVVAWLGTVAFWGITWGTIVMTIASIAVGMWQAANARRAAKDAYNSSLKDRLVSVATTTAYRSRVYGRVRNVDGVLFKAAHGPDSSLYTFVVAVAGHEIDGFETAYFNDIALTLDGSGYVQTAPYAITDITTYSDTATFVGGYATLTLAHPPVAGSIYGGVPMTDRSATFPIVVTSVVGSTVSLTCAQDGVATISYQSSALVPKARVRFYTGAAGQDLSTDLVALGVPGIVAGVHRFAGVACMLITLTYDVDAYSTGVPQFTATIRGAKCLDRRTGLTVWTENPAVIADDWAQYVWGGNLAAGEIAADMVIASANACDVPHSFTSRPLVGAPVVQVMPTYTCGIVCKTDADPSMTLSAIVESMAGQWGWAAGKLRMKAGFYTAPIASIDESWLADTGSRDFNQGLPQNDLVNIYTPQIADKNNAFLTVPVAPVRADAYIALDGRELPVAITLEGVTDVVHAQHVCGVMLRHSRQGFTVNLPCNFKGLVLELFDTVSLTLPRFGLLNKAMEISAWSFSQDGGTNLLMRETSAGIFDPDAGFQLLDESPNTALPLPWQVNQVTGVTVVSGTTLLTDRSVITRTLVSWDVVTQESVLQSGKIEIAYSELGTDAWGTVEESGDSTSTTISGLLSERLYLFKVRARNTLGVRGPWSLQVGVIIATPPSTDATAALAAAAAAQAAADAANAELARIANDNWLTRSEKPAVIVDWTAIADESPGIDAQGVAFGLTSERVAYETAYTALSTYLFSLSPAWNDLSQDTPIVGTTFRATFSDYYSARQVLLNAIANYAATHDIQTGQLAPGAATEVHQDNYDFAGAVFGGLVTGFQTRRSFVVTPPVDCAVEFTASISGAIFSGDNGSGARWKVTPAGGSPIVLAQPGTTSTGISTLHGANSFLAVGGVALTFDLEVAKGGFTSITLYASAIRVTLVKR